MKKLFSILIVLNFFLQLTVAQRISEKKCREYSKIRSTKTYPHMVWLRVATDKIVVTGVIGVLISDQYVLTSVSSAPELIVHSSQVYFTADEEINIVEKHFHPFFGSTAHHDVALLKLERKVKLDGNHRPACLWTEERIQDDEVILMTWKDEFIPSTHEVLSESACSGLHPQQNISLFCTKPLKKEENKYVPASGSPVQVKKSGPYIPDNYFILGIHSFFYSNADPHIMVATKTYIHLDWIENIVWPSSNKNCGIVKVQHQGLIAFGSPTYHGEFPWHVAIQRREGRGLRKYICGGTVLSENTILTAAHCVLDENGVTAPNLLIVSLGKYDLDITNADSREVKVSEVIPHEKFNLNYLENDIALLKLSHLISFSNFIIPICITDDSSIFSTQIGVVAGWGRNEQNNLESLLSKASLPIVSNPECRNSNRGFFPTYLNDRNFCAGYRNGTNVCSGDSGGGLVFQSEGNWYVRGVVSLGAALPNEERCDITQLVLFTDVPKFYDWIVDKL